MSINLLKLHMFSFLVVAFFVMVVPTVAEATPEEEIVHSFWLRDTIKQSIDVAPQFAALAGQDISEQQKFANILKQEIDFSTIEHAVIQKIYDSYDAQELSELALWITSEKGQLVLGQLSKLEDGLIEQLPDSARSDVVQLVGSEHLARMQNTANTLGIYRNTASSLVPVSDMHQGLMEAITQLDTQKALLSDKPKSHLTKGSIFGQTEISWFLLNAHASQKDLQLLRAYYSKAKAKNIFQMIADTYKVEIIASANRAITQIGEIKQNKVVKAFSGDKEALLKDATILLDEGRLGRAGGILNELRVVDKNNPALYHQLARYELKAGSRSTHHETLGRFFFKSGALDTAAKYLDHGLELDPNRSDTYVLYGYVAFQQGNLDKSRKLLSKARALKTKYPWLQLNWADLLYEEARLANDLTKRSEAIKIYESEAAKDGSDISITNSALERLRDHYRNNQQYENVVEVYRRYVETSRNPHRAHHGLATILLEHLDDVDGALESIQRALKIRDFSGGQGFLAKVLLVKASRAPSQAEGKNYVDQAKALASPGDLGGIFLMLARTHPRDLAALAKYDVDFSSSFDKDNMGGSVLHRAIMFHSFDDVRELIDVAGIDLDEFASDHGTPLHVAYYNGRDKIFEYLLEKGADPSIKTREGRTLLEMMDYPSRKKPNESKQRLRAILEKFL